MTSIVNLLKLKTFFALVVLSGVSGWTASAQAQAKKEPLPGSASAGLEPGPSAGATPEAASAKKTWEDIVVVPRKAFLKSGRLELAPFTGITVNDLLIRHYAFGADINYFLTDVFSVGLQGQYFIKERSDREGLVGLQYNRVPTLNRYKYAGALNFGYVPGYGKFSLFNRFIWHWDIFVTGGVGLIWSEIIPRSVGDEKFSSMNIAPDFGIGTRFFINQWLTVSLAFRDYVFNDKFEPTNRAPGETGAAAKDHAQSELVNHVMFTASVGFFLPTSFQYKSPR